MNRDDIVDVLILAAWFVVFFEIGVLVGRRIERLYTLSYIISHIKKNEVKSKNESTTERTE